MKLLPCNKRLDNQAIPKTASVYTQNVNSAELEPAANIIPGGK
jgi:hypothetical protein